jgi:hypothetical protein
MRASGAKRAIVVGPKRVCSMWADLLAQLGLPVIRGYQLTSVKLVEHLQGQPEGVLVVSEDVLRRMVSKSYSLTDRILLWKPRAYIRDESHNDAHPRSARSRASQRIQARVEWYRPLTGTPVPNHFGDLWPQLHTMDPDKWGTTFNQFADRFLVRDTIYPSRIVGHVNTDLLQDMILRAATTVRRESIFGPDTFVENVREVEMPERARTQYDKLVRDWMLSREAGDEATVRADHTLTRMIRLQQAAAGYLVDEHGVETPLHTAKVDAVLADLGEIFTQGEKSVIYHRFDWEARLYAQRIAEEFPDIPLYAINGRTSSVEADAIWRERFPKPGPAVVVVQVRSGGIGISLAESSHAQFVSTGFSFASEYEQPRDRIYKPGCTRIVTFYQTKNTVDEHIHQTILSKKNVHDNVMSVDVQQLAFGRFYRPRMKR